MLRSLTSRFKIAAAVPLEPRLIKASLDLNEWDGYNEAYFRGLGGTKVPRAEWFEPSPDILPPLLGWAYFSEDIRIL
jgi:hypothetical protein